MSGVPSARSRSQQTCTSGSLEHTAVETVAFAEPDMYRWEQGAMSQISSSSLFVLFCKPARTQLLQATLAVF
jgi:hypothetical protein